MVKKLYFLDFYEELDFHTKFLFNPYPANVENIVSSL